MILRSTSPASWSSGSASGTEFRLPRRTSKAKPGTVTGWKLPQVERDMLLQRFPPKYENVVADHVTLRVGATAETPLPRKPDSSKVVGRADDGESLECLVVELDGTTDRPDGSTYHITWSLGPGRRARESNAVLRDKGWEFLEAPIPVELEPARF
jgi:hypothetical protein